MYRTHGQMLYHCHDCREIFISACVDIVSFEWKACLTCGRDVQPIHGYYDADLQVSSDGSLLDSDRTLLIEKY